MKIYELIRENSDHVSNNLIFYFKSKKKAKKYAQKDYVKNYAPIEQTAEETLINWFKSEIETYSDYLRNVKYTIKKIDVK
jgi:hypothetical protein